MSRGVNHGFTCNLYVIMNMYGMPNKKEKNDGYIIKG